jgi:hypothetical protein
MKITRENYESFFIDYLEGTLDKRLVDDFIDFLQNNPDLKEELTFVEPLTIQPEEIVFEKKEQLYKQHFDSEQEFNRAAIAGLEGDLSEKQKNEFDKYLALHPEKQKDVELFKKTKLLPDESIVFHKKKKLYRYTIGRSILLWSGRIAAVLILALAIFSLVDNNSNNSLTENQVAKVEKETSKKEKAPETKQTQVQQETKTIPTEKEKNNARPEIKKPKPIKKSNTRIHENSTGRMKNEDIALKRIPVEVPETMQTMVANFETSAPRVYLAAVKPKNSVFTTHGDERLLADVVREKTNIEDINLNKIAKVGLKLISGFTKENFTYETNENGAITEYNYDSRLLAFTIPARNETDGE